MLSSAFWKLHFRSSSDRQNHHGLQSDHHTPCLKHFFETKQIWHCHQMVQWSYNYHQIMWWSDNWHLIKSLMIRQLSSDQAFDAHTIDIWSNFWWSDNWHLIKPLMIRQLSSDHLVCLSDLAVSSDHTYNEHIFVIWSYFWWSDNCRLIILCVVWSGSVPSVPPLPSMSGQWSDLIYNVCTLFVLSAMYKYKYKSDLIYNVCPLSLYCVQFPLCTYLHLSEFLGEFWQYGFVGQMLRQSKVTKEPFFSSKVAKLGMFPKAQNAWNKIRKHNTKYEVH